MLPLALMDLGTLKGFAIVTMLGVIIGIIVTRPAYGRIIMEILSK
jgi:preprotein translocase subunit SecD